MKLIKNEEGQSLVEFAILIPVLMIIIMGIFEFGFILNAYITINSSSREGARLASVGGTDLEIRDKVVDSSPNLDSSNLEIIILPSEGNRNRGDTVTVYINYDYQVKIPLIGAIINNSVELNAETSMRIE